MKARTAARTRDASASIDGLAEQLGHALARLAALAERHRPDAPPGPLVREGRAQGWSYGLPAPSADKLAIAVADGHTLAFFTMDNPLGRPTAPARPRDSLAADVALRLAEIETALAELDPRIRSRETGPSASPLTEQEALLLARGGAAVQQAAGAAERSVVRTAAEYAALVRQSYSVAQAAKRLGVNASRVRQRLGRDARTLYGFRLGHAWRLPRFQFAGRRLVPGIARVLPQLPRDLHPVAVYRWFTTPNPDLPGDDDERPLSPLEWLRTGRSPTVVAELGAGL